LKHRHVVYIALLLSAYLSPALPADEIWRKAVEYAEKAALWQAETVRVITEVRDKSGELEKRSVIEMELEKASTSVPVYQVASASEDGKDITGKTRKNFEKEEESANRFVAGLSISHFIPQLEETLAYEPLPSSAYGGSGAAYRFSLQHRTEKDELLGVEGTALIDPESGAPLGLDYTISEGPKTLQYMNVSISFRENVEQISLPALLAMELGVKLLFMEKRIDLETRYGGYRRFPESKQ
jgi:hypothetical protein